MGVHPQPGAVTTTIERKTSVMSQNRWMVLLAILAVSIFLSGCGTPVPPEKARYVGEWRSREMYLLITEDSVTLTRAW